MKKQTIGAAATLALPLVLAPSAFGDGHECLGANGAQACLDTVGSHNRQISQVSFTAAAQRTGILTVTLKGSTGSHANNKVDKIWNFGTKSIRFDYDARGVKRADGMASGYWSVGRLWCSNSGLPAVTGPGSGPCGIWPDQSWWGPAGVLKSGHNDLWLEGSFRTLGGSGIGQGETPAINIK